MIAPSDVSAVLVTRGDVDLQPIVDSLAGFGEIVVWNNAHEVDLAVYGRYAALDRCTRDAVYVQDDDVILDRESLRALLAGYEPGVLVANMPERFRHDFYADHCLVGFGAIFDRQLPSTAFDRFLLSESRNGIAPPPEMLAAIAGQPASFHHTCDIVFTALTPRKLLDLPYTDREFASAPNRMWKQPEHVGERTRMLDLVRKVAA